MKRWKKGSIIRDVRNLFRLKKEKNDTTIKDTRNFFRLTKENEAIRDRAFKGT